MVARALRACGVDRLFGLCGHQINPLFDACVDAGVQVIDTRHESGATHMADGWARFSGSIGVSAVTAGAGHANSVTGIATAWMAGSPMLAISAQVGAELSDMRAPNSFDQVAMVAGVTKFARSVTEPTRLAEYVTRAIRVALAGRPGPVHLSIPPAVFNAEVDEPVLSPIAPAPPRVRPPPGMAAEVIARLRRAERPLIIAGNDVWWHKAGEPLRAFLEATSLPCFTIGAARGAVSDDHPLCIGSGDTRASETARQSYRRADCVLLLGDMFDFRLGFGRGIGNVEIMQVHLDAEGLGQNRIPALAVAANAAEMLEEMLPLATGSWPELPWVGELRELRKGEVNRVRPPAGGLHPAEVAAVVDRTLGASATYSVDLGDFGLWSLGMVAARHPGSLSAPSGTAGSAIPMAVAASLARPERTAVALVGDGAFGFLGWELQTALRFGAPVVVVVGNDRGWGMERQIQQAAYHRTVGVELGDVSYARVVEAMGGVGLRARNADELAAALVRARDARTVACVEVDIASVPCSVTENFIARH